MAVATTTIMAVALGAIALATKIIELRLEHYKVNPELREQDAANAELFGKWFRRLLVLLERLSVELDLDEG